ncbi:MAG: hypothetical protein R3B13_24615 [Polyangiaceae bacterium]
MKPLRGLGLMLLLAVGCESIAGIEDRTFEAPVSGSPECEAYCTDVMSACSAQFAAYPSRTSCVQTCDALPRGEAALANSVECRAAKAKLAVTTQEPASDCPGAGPYGLGTCGSICQAYCSLLEALCPAQASAVKDCESSCTALEASGVYDLSKIAKGDTLECRIHHLTLAAQDASECDNAAILPRGGACSDPGDTPADCDDVCRVAMAACSGGLAVYESEAQCKAVCKALPQGVVANTTENTAGCRLYHAYSAVADPNTHCPHVGPLGDGHCGHDEGAVTGNCESYCLLAEEACATDFASKFSSQDDCMKDCVSLPGAKLDQGYAVASVGSGDNVQCRALQLSRALDGQSAACAGAFGAAPCN